MKRLPASTLAVALLCPALLTTAPAWSQAAGPLPTAGDAKNAGNHFRRGVSLYKDGDYGGALVEFQRAYDSAPNYHVLYDIGQSLYQLQRYAEALTSFESYLTKGGARIPPARRASVESDIRTLRTRVGHVTVTVNADGAEISVDDQVVGTSPLAEPVLVSVGHRKVRVSKAGRAPLEKFVDIAAGDSAKMSFDLVQPPVPAPVVEPAPPTPGPEMVNPPPEPPPSPPLDRVSTSRSNGLWIPWTATGLLVAGTAVTGVLALTSQSSMNSQLNTFPGNPGALDDDRNRTKAFSLASDILLAAAAVSLSVSVYLTVSHRGQERALRQVRPRIVLGPQGLQLLGGY